MGRGLRTIQWVVPISSHISCLANRWIIVGLGRRQPLQMQATKPLDSQFVSDVML